MGVYGAWAVAALVHPLLTSGITSSASTWTWRVCHDDDVDVVSLLLCVRCLVRPIAVFDELYISSVYCGANFVFALSAFGDAYSWGVNTTGQLMQGTTSSYSGVGACLHIPDYHFWQVCSLVAEKVNVLFLR